MKFKDTKIGKFLADRLPDAIGVIGDVLPSNGILGVVKGIIASSTKLSDAEKKHAEDLINQEIDVFKTEVADTQNARQMQIEALKQDDKFSKRFVMYLTLLITGTTAGFIAGLYFVQIPKENKDIVYMAVGAFLAAFSGCISFWMGATFSSRKRQEALDNIIKEK